MGRHTYTFPEHTADAEVCATASRSSQSHSEWEAPLPTPAVWRSRIAVAAILAIAVLGGTWWLFRWLTQPDVTEIDQEPITLIESMTPTADIDSGPSSPATILVHVAGAVTTSGVVELSDGARIIDAIEAAGGVTADAQSDGLNLAAPVTDGQYIFVPDSESSVPPSVSSTSPSGIGPAQNMMDNGVVNINTADSDALQHLPGIGPAMAQRIIDHRESVGPFQSLADLDAVSGIGPAMMQRLEGLISW